MGILSEKEVIQLALEKMMKIKGQNAIARLKNFEEATEELYQVLIAPKGLRLILIKWLFPEIVKVADTLKDCYWYNAGSK